MLTKELQPLNALERIVVTESATVMFVTPDTFIKAYSPIERTPSGIIMVFSSSELNLESAVQPLNAPSPIAVTESGTVTSVISTKLLNA